MSAYSSRRIRKCTQSFIESDAIEVDESTVQSETSSGSIDIDIPDTISNRLLETNNNNLVSLENINNNSIDEDDNDEQQLNMNNEQIPNIAKESNTSSQGDNDIGN